MDSSLHRVVGAVTNRPSPTHFDRARDGDGAGATPNRLGNRGRVRAKCLHPVVIFGRLSVDSRCVHAVSAPWDLGAHEAERANSGRRLL
jgi:hypothetical protein